MIGLFAAGLVGLSAVNAASPTEYIGAVAQHDCYMGSDSGKEQPSELLKKNLDMYANLASLAASKQANVIVFPEFGITAAPDSERASLYPFAEQMTSVTSPPETPCTDAQFSADSIQKRSSCMARENGISVLVNTIEAIPCSADSDNSCPDDGQYLYNTDIVYDETGAFVAKYHKSHEWPGLKPPYDQPAQPSQVTYNSTFGVEFGIFTCFDIMWQNPPVELVKQGLKHFLYPVMQGEIGEKTLISGWSRRHDVTILSSNLGAGEGKRNDDDGKKDCSGIIRSGKDLPLEQLYLRDFADEFVESDDSVLVGAVPV